ncbi:PX domain protein [Aspergillus novofumigatus IBT 16806]|uniref:PX domain protein n=1 Tax=Aspergillus novofumigatus (strain IBT 16806) TaxID=1392255 RepID=A0A2I1CLU5_ASPN1|nr:PX domain protein [Aspergillus novofumigatus IBT 16806]PKX98576.1 PX domain protein [Aspergillus novofumigatus IBT 16806]
MDDSIDRPLPSPLSETCSDVRDATDCLLTSRRDDFNRPSDLIPTITPSKGPVDYMLRFLSSADNLTLTWFVASLAIVTYVLLGRIGLLLIGLVAGVTLHASWEAADTGLRGDPTGTSSIYRRKELSLNIANRLLQLSSRRPSEPKSNNGGIIAEAAEGLSEPDLDFSGFPPKTAAALRSLTNAVIKDYVNHWYEPILPAEQMFPLSCRKLLRDFIISLSSHLSRKRPADAFLEFLTNSSSMVIVLLNELSAAFQHVEGHLTPEDAVKRYLDLHPESSLANILSEQQQRLKLKMVADDILSSFLEPGAYACSVLREFLREILAGVVLESAISSLSRSETINGWIIHLLKEGESELLNAIDAGVEGAKEQVVAVEGAHEENRSTTVPFSKSDIEGKPAGHSDTYGILPTTKVVEVPIYPPEGATVRTQDLQVQTARLCSPEDVQSSDSQSTMLPHHSLVGTQDKEATIHTPMAKDAAEIRNDYDPTKIASTKQYPPVQPTDPCMAPPASHLPDSPSKKSPVTTLHHASVSVEELSEASEKASIRSKLTSSYLIQIEPAATRRTGWMIFRNYADFESLHGTLGTIARLNKLQDFTESYPALPPWKGQTKGALVRNLERYLKDALQYEALADCERMKRFLEKDERLDPGASDASAKSGFPFPTSVALENMGKGMLGVLTNAPKGVAEGGKAVIGGVTGVFGGANGKKTSFSSKGYQGNHGRSLSTRSISQMNYESIVSDSVIGPKRPVSENDKTERYSLAVVPTPESSSSQEVHPSPGSGDVVDSTIPRFGDLAASDSKLESHHLQGPLSDSDGGANIGSRIRPKEEQRASDGQSTVRRQESPISQEETQIAVELIFAVINELYSLSSAWNIRRTLLNAAKSYILRPGSPSLETIRTLLQESMIDANTSDASIASGLTKLRENVLPTKEELESWPQSPSSAEKERMRETARKTLVLKGLPQALTSVMGPLLVANHSRGSLIVYRSK